MDLKEASLLALNVAKKNWFVVFRCSLIISLAEGAYIFGIYSEAIKTFLGYDKKTLTTLGFFKDLGGNVGIVSGLINGINLPWVLLGTGAIMNITGYLMIWLSVTQRIARPKTWQMCVYICMGADSLAFSITVALVTCVKNFPQSRGTAVGILKGFFGLSGAVFTQIYHVIYGQTNPGVILLLGILPAAVSLAIMLIMRPTKVVADKKKLKCFYSFLYIALALGGLLMIMIVVGKALGYTPVNISTFISLISIWNFLGRTVAAFRSEFLMRKYKFLRPLLFTKIVLIARVGHVIIEFALPGLLYVAQWPKSLRSSLVNGLYFIDRKWREGENMVLMKHLPYCGYILDLKEASLLARNVAKGRWSGVFICFLIMFPAEGAFMRGMHSETQSAQTFSDTDINQCVPVVHSETVVHLGNGKHSTERTVAAMESGIKNRKLFEPRKPEPRKPKLNVGQPAQHN